MNVITIAGNIGRDAELKYTPGGDAVASFSVADSQGKDKLTIWWRCALWGKRAESLAKYMTKGSKVTVSGQVTEREYTDKDGQQRRAMEVRVIDVALQGGGEEVPTKSASHEAPNPSKSSGFEDMDSDIPF